MGKSAQTPAASTVHHPLGREGLWHTPSRKVPELQQLPAYIQNTARALIRTQGMEEGSAIATAVSAVKEWASGVSFGGKTKVTPEVQQAAQQALAGWEELKESHHALLAEIPVAEEDHHRHHPHYRHKAFNRAQGAAEGKSLQEDTWHRSSLTR